MGLVPLGGVGGGSPVYLAAAAVFYRRSMRSQIARLSSAALPAVLSDKALMLMDTLISSYAVGGLQCHEELVCCINFHPFLATPECRWLETKVIQKKSNWQLRSC